MNRRTRFVALAACLVLMLAPNPSRAAFDEIEVSPRLRAIGGAGAAIEGNAYAALHNPASLAWNDGTVIAGSYLRPFSLSFVSQNAFAGTIPLPGRAGGVGVAVRQLGVRVQGQKLEDETTLSVAHGFHLMRDAQSELAVGWSVSLYSLSFGTSVTGLDPGGASTIGIGIGAVATVRGRTRVGFAVQDLNSPTLGERDHQELSRRLTGGLAYTPYAGVTTAMDIGADLAGTMQYRGGVELEATDFLRLRAGVCTEPNAFTAGLGLSVRGLRLDYGFSSGGVLAETHHVGLELRAHRSKREP